MIQHKSIKILRSYVCIFWLNQVLKVAQENVKQIMAEYYVPKLTKLVN